MFSNSKDFGRHLEKDQASFLDEWVAEQNAGGARTDLMKLSQLRDDSREFLTLFTDAYAHGTGDLTDPRWNRVKEFLKTISKSRSLLGFSPSETARFILSFKKPFFARLQKASSNAEELAGLIWTATELLDDLGLLTTEAYQKVREEVIIRQQQDMLELSTPVVKLWTGILALPMIGTLDSSRTQVVMETLLQRIVETGSEIAIIDITGVPTVDTLVAQHLLKTVTAARLMGAECIISGIRPQIAATIVHLGVDLGEITTKATLADAFRLALQRTGQSVARATAVEART